MKYLIIITAMLLTGCAPDRHYWIVKCDSGFETPKSFTTYIDDGIITWRVTKYGQTSKRKMIAGEICRDIKTRTLLDDSHT